LTNLFDVHIISQGVMLVSLDDSVVKQTKEQARPGKPTQKQLDYLKKLAKTTGTALSEDDVSSFKKASAAIDRLQKQIKPTEKQIAFARKIAESKGIEVPPEAFESRSAMSRWLDRETEGK